MSKVSSVNERVGQSLGASDTLARVSKDTSYLTIGQILAKVFSFSYLLMLAQLLTVDDFGRFSLIISFALIAEVFADFGLSRILVKDLARDEALIPKYVGAILLVKLPLSILTFTVLILFLWFAGYSNDIIFLTAIAGLSILPYGLSHVFENTIHARQNFISMAGTQLYLAVGHFVFGAVALYLSISLEAVFIAMILSYSSHLFVLTIVMRRLGYHYDLQWDWSFSYRLLKLSAPYMLMSILTLLASRAELLVLSQYESNINMGIYSGATKIPEAALFVPLMFANVLSPIFSRLHISSKERLTNIFNFSARVVLLVMVPAVFIGYLIAEPVLVFLMSEKYQDSVPILQLILLAFPLTSLYLVNITVLYTADQQLRSMLVLMVLTFLQYFINFILIPQAGIDGAVASLILSQIINVVVTLFVIRIWFVGPGMFKALVPPVIATAGLLLSFTQYNFSGDILQAVFPLLIFIVIAAVLWRFFPTEFNPEAD